MISMNTNKSSGLYGDFYVWVSTFLKAHQYFNMELQSNGGVYCFLFHGSLILFTLLALLRFVVAGALWVVV